MNPMGAMGGGAYPLLEPLVAWVPGNTLGRGSYRVADSPPGRGCMEPEEPTPQRVRLSMGLLLGILLGILPDLLGFTRT